MNSVRSNNISLKYQKFTTLGSKDIEIINSEFVAKTQFLCLKVGTISRSDELEELELSIILVIFV